MAWKPARSSYGRVPVSKRRPSGLLEDGRALLGAPGSGDLGTQVSNPEMRAAELVRRAKKDIAADVLDIDRLVRRVVDSVDPRERPDLACQAADPLGLGDRSGGVRGEGERDDARLARRQLPLEVVEIDREVIGGLDHVDGQSLVGCQLDPGGYAAVVVERCRHDLVAGREISPRGSGQREVQGRHVHAECDLGG